MADRSDAYLELQAKGFSDQQIADALAERGLLAPEDVPVSRSGVVARLPGTPSDFLPKPPGGGRNKAPSQTVDDILNQLDPGSRLGALGTIQTLKDAGYLVTPAIAQKIVDAVLEDERRTTWEDIVALGVEGLEFGAKRLAAPPIRAAGMATGVVESIAGGMETDPGVLGGVVDVDPETGEERIVDPLPLKGSRRKAKAKAKAEPQLPAHVAELVTDEMLSPEFADVEEGDGEDVEAGEAGDVEGGPADPVGPIEGAFVQTEEDLKARMGNTAYDNLRTDVIDNWQGIMMFAAELAGFDLGGKDLEGGALDFAGAQFQRAREFGHVLGGGATGGLAAMLANPEETMKTRPVSAMLALIPVARAAKVRIPPKLQTLAGAAGEGAALLEGATSRTGRAARAGLASLAETLPKSGGRVGPLVGLTQGAMISPEMAVLGAAAGMGVQQLVPFVASKLLFRPTPAIMAAIRRWVDDPTAQHGGSEQAIVDMIVNNPEAATSEIIARGAGLARAIERGEIKRADIFQPVAEMAEVRQAGDDVAKVALKDPDGADAVPRRTADGDIDAEAEAQRLGLVRQEDGTWVEPLFEIPVDVRPGESVLPALRAARAEAGVLGDVVSLREMIDFRRRVGQALDASDMDGPIEARFQELAELQQQLDKEVRKQREMQIEGRRDPGLTDDFARTVKAHGRQLVSLREEWRAMLADPPAERTWQDPRSGAVFTGKASDVVNPDMVPLGEQAADLLRLMDKHDKTAGDFAAEVWAHAIRKRAASIGGVAREMLTEAERLGAPPGRSVPRLRESVRGAHSGQIDGTISAFDDQGVRSGFVDYAETGDGILIQKIEVEQQRKGVGTALVSRLAEKVGYENIEWGMLTDDGAALKVAMDRRFEYRPATVVDAGKFAKKNNAVDVEVEPGSTRDLLQVSAKFKDRADAEAFIAEAKKADPDVFHQIDDAKDHGVFAVAEFPKQTKASARRLPPLLHKPMPVAAASYRAAAERISAWLKAQDVDGRLNSRRGAGAIYEAELPVVLEQEAGGPMKTPQEVTKLIRLMDTDTGKDLLPVFGIDPKTMAERSAPMLGRSTPVPIKEVPTLADPKFRALAEDLTDHVTATYSENQVIQDVSQPVTRALQDAAPETGMRPDRALSVLSQIMADDGIGALRSPDFAAEVAKTAELRHPAAMKHTTARGLEAKLAEMAETGITSILDVRTDMPNVQVRPTFVIRTPDGTLDLGALTAETVARLTQDNPTKLAEYRADAMRQLTAKVATDRAKRHSRELIHAEFERFRATGVSFVGWMDDLVERVLVDGEAMPQLLTRFDPNTVSKWLEGDLDGIAADVAAKTGESLDSAKARVKGMADEFQTGYRPPADDLMSELPEYVQLATKQDQLEAVTMIRDSDIPSLKAVAQGFNETLGWHFRLARHMEEAQGGFGAMLRLVKGNLTAQNPSSHINNFLANVGMQSIKQGKLPATVIADLRNAYRTWQRHLKGEIPDPEDRLMLDAIERSGIMDTTLIHAEMGGPGSKGLLGVIGDRFPGLRPVAGVVEKVPDGMERMYAWGDGIFKLDETLRQSARIKTRIGELRPGEWLSLDQPRGRRKYIVNRGDGDLVVTDKQPPDARHKAVNTSGQSVGTMDDLHDLIVRSGRTSADNLFFDYGDLPLFLKMIKVHSGGLGSSFLTWGWKSMDIPGLKKGLVHRSIIPDDVVSNSAAIRAEAAQAFAKLAARRATIGAALRQEVIERNPESLRQLFRFMPKEQSLVMLNLASDPTYIEAMEKATVNSFATTDALFRGGMAAFLTVQGWLDPEWWGENGFDIGQADSAEDLEALKKYPPDKAKDVLRRRELWRKHAAGEIFSESDALELIGLAGTPFVEVLHSMMENEQLDGRDAWRKRGMGEYWRDFGGLFVGGLVHKISDIAWGAYNERSDFTTRSWAMREDPRETAQHVGPWGFLRWTTKRLAGLGWNVRKVTGKKGAFDQFWDKREKAITSSLTKEYAERAKRWEREIKALKTAAMKDGNAALGRQALEQQENLRALKRKIGRMKAEIKKEMAVVRRHARSVVDKIGPDVLRQVTAKD